MVVVVVCCESFSCRACAHNGTMRMSLGRPEELVHIIVITYITVDVSPE